MSLNKIKIGYFADGPWSHLAFEKLIQDKSLDIKFIVPRTDTKDNTLKDYSIKYNIDYLFPVKINSPEFIAKVIDYNCDLLVSMSFNQIFKRQIISIPKLGVINCHAGKLPFYRGRNILNWALINDEKDFGITVHYVDEGIDTGDIIKQKKFPINDSDSYNSLLKIAFIECANILYEAIKEIQLGNSNRIKQSFIHPVGFYCGRRGEGDEIINWNKNSRELFNFIRAIDKPGPMATTFVKGNVVKINKSRIVSEAIDYIGTNGQILAKTNDGFFVKTKDNFLEILEIESNYKLRVGDKLGI
ncbi:methionyl-tRNA formyltransferase [Polaribacter sp. MED152]|uniref:methionyl-tRNA formyltransferase n=1 Tax=Polaribacter sp. MED152 TaxID=313598 RepID=UPI000186F4DF|nr:methionyl-tRNA formyltransferase [Polaribacter sp. MED152]EAQ42186.2 methionyl-tRNA formyltransferase [Polaribacter sp. MED152]